MVGAVAVLAVELLERIPTRLLVRQIDSPLNVLDAADHRLSGLLQDDFYLVADLNLFPLLQVVIVAEDAEPRGLPLDAPFAVLELRDGLLGAVRVQLVRYLPGLLGRAVELVGAVADARDSDGGGNLESHRGVSWYEFLLIFEVQRDAFHPEGVRHGAPVDVEHDEVDLKVGLALLGQEADGLGRVDAEVAGRLAVARAQVILAARLLRHAAVAGRADALARERGELRDEMVVATRRRVGARVGLVEEDADEGAARS